MRKSTGGDMNIIRRTLRTAAAALLAAAAVAAAGCHFIDSFSSDDGEDVRSMTFDRNSLEISVGSMDIINLTIDSSNGQDSETVTWEYDRTQITAATDSYSIVVTGIAAGSSVIKASCGGKSVSCALRVLEASESVTVQNPYVYVSSDYVTVEPGGTEKVFASVYGGTYADKDGFTFTSDKPGVASVYVEGNYCWITGKSEGLARISCRHTKCSYPYTFLVSVAASESAVPYITTSGNIVTINKSTETSKSFTVDLKNPTYTTYADDFTYTVTDESGGTMTSPPVSLETAGSKCKVTAVEGGSCFVRVSHPLAAYDCDVLIRVVENVDTAHIEPSSTYITVNGNTSQTVDLTIEGLPDGTAVDADKYEWSFSDGAENYIDYSIYNGSESGKGSSLWITGKKNGAVKVTVSHPLAATARSILIVVKDIASEASSSKIYITTSQNYVETRVGDDDTKISITINNIASAESDLQWLIENEAADGSDDPVIMYSGGTGTATSKSARRGAIAMSSGYAVITPLKEGRATVTISHPKAAYPTKILVTVLAADSVTEEPWSLSTGTPFVSIKNGETESVSAILSGTGKTDGDDSAIVWECSGTGFTVSADGAAAAVTASGTGLHKATLTARHDRAEYPLSIVLAGYDTEEELASLKTIYSAQTAYTIYTGYSAYLNVTATEYVITTTTGTDENGNEYTATESSPADDAVITWSVTSGLNDVIGFTGQGNCATVTGIAAGSAVIEAALAGTSETVTFHITVRQSGVIDETKPCYLMTAQNVVTLTAGNTEDIKVYPVNIDMREYGNIVWTNYSPDIISVSSNGDSATVSALAEGSGIIEVSHPLSKNTLTLTVHVGNEYVYSNTDIAYISCDDTLSLSTDSGETMFYAVLAHTETGETSTDGLSFESSDTDVFTISATAAGGCLVSPKKAGQALLTVSHADAEYDKEVLVIVRKSAAELADIPYISTAQNVATVVQGEYTTLSVTLQNGTNYEPSSWTWTSYDGRISDVAVNSGTTAMISGVSPGTTKIAVSQSDCAYPLEIIVICLDADSVSANPFISTSTNILTLAAGGSATVTAEMTGGTSADSSAFMWSAADSSVALVSGGGGSCYVRGLKAGLTYITVRNTNYADAYTKTVLVRVEDTTDEKCYITVTQSVIKLDPSSTAGTEVTATLENGDVLDAEDFVWWADDYNLVSLAAITDTARIIPTGISGTTYVHVKHPKVLTTVDIIVMCSQYSEFAFQSASKSVLEQSITFIPMEVPATDGTSWVEYESSDSDVCVATGSSGVCMIAGVARGSATVTATLHTGSGVVGTAQMAVIVGRKDEAVNTISMNSTIISMEIGESQTLEALLTGADITAADSYSIAWEVTGGDTDSVALLATENNVTTGKNVYVTAKKAGSAVLTVSHPKCLYDLTVWIMIPEKEDATLTLDQTYIQMYKSDGAVSVTAKVVNGTSSDESSVTWTAPKVGGVNIVSVSKSTGKTCNIVPRNTGSTVLRAQLPNGNYADCVVTVLTDAEITLETRTIHVNPGFSETVSYTVTPENAVINWVETMNGSSSLGSVTDYFSFSVNESSRIITITGKELGSGVLYCYSATDSGTAKAQLSVICEYNYVVEFGGNAGVVQMQPDDSGNLTTATKKGNTAEIPFSVYPKSGLDIKVTSSCPEAVEISSYSVDPATGEGTVYVKALTEEIGGYITLTATNPDDPVNTPISKKKYINSKYDEYTITPVFDFESGSFSSYDKNSGVLTLGDGESYTFYLDVEQPNAKIDNFTLTFTNGDTVDGLVGTAPELETNSDKITETSKHIYFSGSDKSKTTLSPETTDADGRAHYRIGHNWDYKAENAGYLTNGDVKAKIRLKYKLNYTSDHHNGKNANPTLIAYVNIYDDEGNFKYTETKYVAGKESDYSDWSRGSSNKKFSASQFIQRWKLIYNKYYVLQDSKYSYFYYAKDDFYLKQPYMFSWEAAGEDRGNKNNPTQVTNSWDWLDLGPHTDDASYVGAYGCIPYPTYVGSTTTASVVSVVNNNKSVTTVEPVQPSAVSRNQSVIGTPCTAEIDISYMTVDGAQGGTVSIPIRVERRDCPKNTSGLWEPTTDSNGTPCWGYKGKKEELNTEEILTPSEYKYLIPTEGKDVVHITTVGDTAELSITGVGISDFQMATYTKWEVEDASVATVEGSGSSAVVTAVSEGVTAVNVTNKYSENSVSIEIRVGTLDDDDDED